MLVLLDFRRSIRLCVILFGEITTYRLNMERSAWSNSLARQDDKDLLSNPWSHVFDVPDRDVYDPTFVSGDVFYSSSSYILALVPLSSPKV